MTRGTVVVVAVMAAQCGGRSSPTAPEAPMPGAPIGVVRSISVDRTNIEAGDEVNLHVSMDGTTPSSETRYTWSVDPAAGSLTSAGASARWRAPLNDPVPATYTFLVSIVQPGGSESATALSATTAAITATSPQVIVNDARRELRAHSEAFLTDAIDPGVSPDMCVRNFSDACEGRQTAVEEIASRRAAYTTGTVSYDLQLFVRSVEWPNCTAADGSARCAVLVYKVDLVLTPRAGGAQERVSGDQYMQGVYDRNRWWLCSSRFTTAAGTLRQGL